jgi:hypothetical protein
MFFYGYIKMTKVDYSKQWEQFENYWVDKINAKDIHPATKKSQLAVLRKKLREVKQQVQFSKTLEKSTLLKLGKLSNAFKPLIDFAVTVQDI